MTKSSPIPSNPSNEAVDSPPSEPNSGKPEQEPPELTSAASSPADTGPGVFEVNDNYVQVLLPDWAEHIKNHPDDKQYLTTPGIPLNKLPLIGVMKAEHCYYGVLEVESGKVHGGEAPLSAKALNELAEDEAQEHFGNFKMPELFFAIIHVFHSLLANFHPATVIMKEYHRKHCAARAATNFNNATATLIHSYTVGVFNSTDKRSIQNIINNGDADCKARAEEALKYFEENYGKYVVPLYKTIKWQFVRKTICEINVMSWKSETRKFGVLGMFSNFGYKARKTNLDRPPHVRGFPLSVVLNMDRISDIFDGTGNGEIPELGNDNNTVLASEYAEWNSRFGRKLYASKKEATSSDASEQTSGNKRKAVAVTTRRVMVKTLAFTDGFPSETDKALLEDYEGGLQKMKDDEVLRRAFDRKVGMDDAFTQMFDNKYFALACALCSEKDRLHMALDKQGNFCVNLENMTKKLLGRIGSSKRPATK